MKESKGSDSEHIELLETGTRSSEKPNHVSRQLLVC